MKKDKKEYRLPSRKQPVFSKVKVVLRWFYKRPRIVNLAGDVSNKALFVANHVSKKGPMIYELYFPYLQAKWGAGEMLGNYASRKAYLKEVFYIQKRGFSPRKAGFKAGFEAIFSIYFYRGMKILPTFPDARLKSTIEKSIKVLNNDIPIMIFPENSAEGYFDVITQFLSGFVLLANYYYKKEKIDLPIYPVYYHPGKNIIVIDKPGYSHEMFEQGLNKEQVAEVFRLKVNELYYRIENGDFDNK